MIWHFLKIVFFLFVPLVLFVNLFQFAGAELPFETTWYHPDIQEGSIFGFGSLFNFFSFISNDSDINTSINCMTFAFKIIKEFSIDEFNNLFLAIQDFESQSPSIIIAVMLGFILNFIMDCLIAPIIMIVSFLAVVIGIIMFAWNFIEIFARFMAGYYNTSFISSGLLEAYTVCSCL